MTAQNHRISNITFFVLLALFLAVFSLMIWPYLFALVMGVMLAMLTRPLYAQLVRRGAGPKVSAAVSLAVILLAVIVPLAVFAAVALNQGIDLFNYLSSDNGLVFLRSAVAAVTNFKPLYWVVNSPADLQQKGLEFLKSAASALSTVILVQAASLPDLALKFIITLLTWFSMLSEGDIFLKWLLGKVPLEPGLRNRLIDSLKATTASTVWASSAAAASQAVLVMAGFWILGVPGIFLAAGATFIFAWIPILGSLPVCAAGAIYLYFQGSMVKMAAMAVVAVAAGLIDNVVRPIVLKGHGDMHPLLAMVSIFSGIQLFGILGVIFGPVVAAMLLSLLNSWSVGTLSDAAPDRS